MKKRLLLLCLLLALQLVACTPDSPPAGGAAEGEVYDLRLSPEARNQANLAQSFVETTEGYYYATQGIIYFCQRGAAAFYPLCSKPNCSHSGKDCNAWCGTAFGYYDGALFATDGDWPQTKVVKMNLDGTNHEVVAKINTSNLGGTLCQFHNGKLFIGGWADANLPIEEQEAHLIVLNLADYSQSELGADFFRTTDMASFVCFHKDKMYGLVGQELGHSAKYDELRLVELDAASDTVRPMVSKPISLLYATDSTLYYLEEDTSYLTEILGYEVENVEHPGFREYDLKTGAIKDCGLPVEDAHLALYDEDYIYLKGFSQGEEDAQTFTMYFLSRSYELIDQIELKNELGILGVASDRIFFFVREGDYEPIRYYLDKSEIGSHAMRLKPIESP